MPSARRPPPSLPDRLARGLQIAGGLCLAIGYFALPSCAVMQRYPVTGYQDPMGRFITGGVLMGLGLLLVFASALVPPRRR